MAQLPDSLGFRFALILGFAIVVLTRLLRRLTNRFTVLNFRTASDAAFSPWGLGIAVGRRCPSGGSWRVLVAFEGYEGLWAASERVTPYATPSGVTGEKCQFYRRCLAVRTSLASTASNNSS